jgi:hypothetical protein
MRRTFPRRKEAESAWCRYGILNRIRSVSIQGSGSSDWKVAYIQRD